MPDVCEGSRDDAHNMFRNASDWIKNGLLQVTKSAGITHMYTGTHHYSYYLYRLNIIESCWCFALNYYHRCLRNNNADKPALFGSKVCCTPAAVVFANKYLD